MRRHRVDDSIGKAISRLLRVDLIVVNDIRLLPLGTDAAETFYDSSTPPTNDARSRSPATCIPAGFDELMLTTLATAGVDRLLYHTHVVLIHGDSYRLKEATTGKGMTPLATGN